MKTTLLILLLCLGIINMLRIVVFMVASDVHEVVAYRRKKQNITKGPRQPWISVIIPAYNEAQSIRSTVESVLASTYPHFEVIVVDDGSADKTSAIVRRFIKANPNARLKLVRQKNAGKSHALNNAIINHARGSLVMCLDADSRLAQDGLEKAVLHFKLNPKLVALASNMKIASKLSILSIAQKIEYIIGNRFKRSLSVMNIEYIIGGIGSTFRKSHLKRIGYYDTDTMTEDIDLSMKIIKRLGNNRYKIDYGFDVHTYTQAVPNLKDLVKQRYRWKYGRMQTFYKNRDLFFSRNSKHSKLLTHLQLPYAVYGDIMLAVEPLILLYVIVNLVLLRQPQVILWGVAFMALYVSWIVISGDDDHKSLPEKLKLLLYAPFSWFLFYMITFVDFCAYVKCLRQLRALPASLQVRTAQWEHVERTV
ncbi:MAG TPA: glycosyltransferase family 2 protein [Patescibacteria group bacterium]|nr:glycosyltransferase family 2 protein [Patescibacteria group bacterium]